MCLIVFISGASHQASQLLFLQLTLNLAPLLLIDTSNHVTYRETRIHSNHPEHPSKHLIMLKNNFPWQHSNTLAIAQHAKNHTHNTLATVYQCHYNYQRKCKNVAVFPVIRGECWIVKADLQHSEVCAPSLNSGVSPTIAHASVFEVWKCLASLLILLMSPIKDVLLRWHWD